MSKGLYHILKDLEMERLHLSVSLRETYNILLLNKSESLIKTIIKRDLNRFVIICLKIKELENMRDELEELFGGRHDSKVSYISNFKRKTKLENRIDSYTE